MDIKLHYTETGTGYPLILLHGNSESGEVFVHQKAYFSNVYRVIAVDTRGHGQSPRGTEPFTIRQFVKDLHEFMDDLKIEKAHLLGFSDGGNIALLFAIQYPERVNKLIVSGANLDTSGIKGIYQGVIELGYKFASFMTKIREGAKKNVEFLSLMVNDPNIKIEDLKKIKAPTLVMAGTKDMVKENHTKLIKNTIPNASLVIIEGTHFIPVKKHEVFNKEVKEFLDLA